MSLCLSGLVAIYYAKHNIIAELKGFAIAI